jgi:hypothetical protein
LVASIAIVVAEQQNIPWPIDLRVCGIFAAFWAFYLARCALTGDPMFEAARPIHAIAGGFLVYGQEARIVMLAEAGIFWAIAVGLIAARRWGLVLALFYMAEIVMSHLLFIAAYLDNRAEWYHVRLAANEGPFVVLLMLYLWIRACDLIFAPEPHS